METIKNLYPEKNSLPNNVPSIIQTHYLVNGQLTKWQGPVQKVFSPIWYRENNELKPLELGSYPMLSETESLSCLLAAVQAFDHGRGHWPTMTVADRIKHVEDFVFEMQKVRAEVINLLMWEIGKSLKDSTNEFDRTIQYIKGTIDSLKDLDRNSSRFQIESGIIAQVRRAPLGVVLCMGPFNYPLNETFTTLIPALIMGNTVLFKPPKFGVLLYHPLLQAFQKAFPPGVVNTIYGDGPTVVGPVMGSGMIDCLAFIGTHRVADLLKHQHPKPHRLRSVLGLDAKNPALIMEDADLDIAISECVLGSLSYNGQRCTALKVLFVHKSIADKFVAKLSEAIEKLKLGMPWQEQVQITPLAEPDKPSYLRELVRDAEMLGARIANPSGGKTLGSFFTPTILYPVDSRMKVYHQEQFGPVIPVVPFESCETVIEYVVNSNFGQQLSVFTSDSEKLAKMIDPLVNQVCRLNINCQCQRGPDVFPFTGRKDSAEGTLSISDALRVFSIRTLVATKQIEINKSLVQDILQNHRSKFLSTDFVF